MEELLRQIERGLQSNLYFLSIFAALSIPDICGALESNNGVAAGYKYKKWFNDNMANKYSSSVIFTADDCYYFRYSLLHQGRTQHEKSTYQRIIFLEPANDQGCVMHLNKLGDVLNIDVRVFCNDIIAAARNWEKQNIDNPIAQKNNEKLIKRHPNGIAPYIVGVPNKL